MLTDGHDDNNKFLNELREAISAMQSQVINSTNIYIDDNDPLMIVIACCQLMISEFEVLMTRSLRVTEESVKLDVENLKAANAENLKNLNQLINQDFTKTLDTNTQEFVQAMIGKIIDKLEDKGVQSTTKEHQEKNQSPLNNIKLNSLESSMKLISYGIYANLGLVGAVIIYLLMGR